MARDGLVLVGVLLCALCLWLARQPPAPTPTEIDAASTQRLGERLIIVRRGCLIGFRHSAMRMEIEGEGIDDLLKSARAEQESPPPDVFQITGGPGSFTWHYEGWVGAARLEEGLPYLWDAHDDPSGHLLVARLARIESGAWTVTVERMRGEELEALLDRHGIELRRGRYEIYDVQRREADAPEAR